MGGLIAQMRATAARLLEIADALEKLVREDEFIEPEVKKRVSPTPLSVIVGGKT